MSQFFKQLTILIISVLGISQVYAVNWFKVAENNLESVYVDTDSMRRESGRFVTFWYLEDLKVPQKEPSSEKMYKSTKIQSQIDCVNDASKFLYIAEYSESQGSGKIVFSDVIKGQFKPVVPGSIFDVVKSFVCR